MALISPPTDRVFKFNFGSAPPIEWDDSNRRSTQNGETRYELLDDQGAVLATAEQTSPIDIVIAGDPLPNQAVFGGESAGMLGGGG